MARICSARCSSSTSMSSSPRAELGISACSLPMVLARSSSEAVRTSRSHGREVGRHVPHGLLDALVEFVEVHRDRRSDWLDRKPAVEVLALTRSLACHASEL